MLNITAVDHASTFSITTLCIMTLNITILDAQYHYPECRNGACRYAECLGTMPYSIVYLVARNIETLGFLWIASVVNKTL